MPRGRRGRLGPCERRSGINHTASQIARDVIGCGALYYTTPGAALALRLVLHRPGAAVAVSSAAPPRRPPGALTQGAVARRRHERHRQRGAGTVLRHSPVETGLGSACREERRAERDGSAHLRRRRTAGLAAGGIGVLEQWILPGHGQTRRRHSAGAGAVPSGRDASGAGGGAGAGTCCACRAQRPWSFP